MAEMLSLFLCLKFKREIIRSIDIYYNFYRKHRQLSGQLRSLIENKVAYSRGG